MAIVIGLLVLAVPTVPRHDVYRAHSGGQFLNALLHTSAWPVGFSMFVITQGTSFLSSCIVFATASARADPRWRLVAGFFWIAIQVTVLSWSRAIAPTESRYLDLFIVGEIVGAAVAMALLYQRRPKWLGRRLVTLGVAGWFIVILGSYGQTAVSFLPRNLNYGQQGALEEAGHLREYLSHPPNAQAPDQDWMSGLYPDAHVVRQVLDNPLIRAVLPEKIGGGGPENWLATCDDIMVNVAPLLFAIGLVLFANSVMIAIRGPRRPPASDADSDMLSGALPLEAEFFSPSSGATLPPSAK